MIPIVTHYGGFQSYGKIPYTSLKPGHKTLDFNDIYEKSARDQDKMGIYENYNRLNSVYNFSYKTNAKQEDYKNCIKTIKGVDGVSEEDRLKKSKLDENKFCGTKHWETNYNSVIKDPYAQSKATRPSWSLHKPPYQVDHPMGASEYKKIYGFNKPAQIQDKEHQRELMLDNSLKLGTCQMSKHAPGYKGFIPQIQTATKAFEQSKGEEIRNTIIKQNIIQNYKQRIPNYAGTIPSHQTNLKGELRQYCFSTKGESYN